jgi:hypothetical protein
MAAAKRVSRGKPQKPSKRRRRSAARMADRPGAPPEESEEVFDEPAMAVREPIVPVEEPVTSPQTAEDTDTCGLPDEAHVPAPDLH